MLAHLEQWLGLVVRWAHVITGIAWIGASFYFNWLENRLNRQQDEPGIAGDLWAVHGGGFYYLRKLSVAPDALPPELHWFKWEAYATWLTGFALLVLVYYVDATAWLLRPGSEIGPGLGVAIGIASLVLSWGVYDGLCRALAGRQDAALAAALVAWFTGLAWALGEVLSGRAAYLHVGAAIGTVMVANVLLVIIPGQRELVAAVVEQRRPDPAPGQRALLRSRHNNYLTLPVLFLMISAHYPATYGHAQAWAVLLGLGLAGVSIRHYFNIRHRPGPAALFLVAGLALLLGLALITAPPRPPAARPAADPAEPAAPPPTTAEVLAIVERRCASCHAATPTQPGFAVAPLGITLESEAELLTHRQRVYLSVAARSMPLGNITGMTPAERRDVINWHLNTE